MKAVEREKNDLEAAKTEAEEYLALQADVAKKQCILYQKYMYVNVLCLVNLVLCSQPFVLSLE